MMGTGRRSGFLLDPGTFSTVLLGPGMFSGAMLVKLPQGTKQKPLTSLYCIPQIEF